MYILHQVVRSLKRFGGLKELVFALAHQIAYLTLHQSHVAYGLNYITCARLALCPDHGSPFGNAPESLAQVACAAYEGHVELGLVYMIYIIGW